MEEQPIVLVIDDDASVRRALDNLLRSVDLQVRTFSSVEEFRQAEPPDAPACLVLDVRMPGQSGLDFQVEAMEAGIHLPIIFITAHGDIPMSVRAMKAGAIEFLAKPFRQQDLLDAIQQGLRRDQARRRNNDEAAKLHENFKSLTAREREVMEAVVKGRLNKQIAADLKVSEITVKVCRGQVMRKMQARSLPELVRIADRLAISSPKKG